jgi:hypothetical protein
MRSDQDAGMTAIGPARRYSTWFCILTASTLTLAGCASDATRRDAINDINRAFKAEYEAILARDGTRAFAGSPDQVFNATNAALVSLGIVIKQQSRGLGYLQGEAPAPLPLTRIEWDRTSAADLPKARDLLRKYFGPLADTFKFEPEGIDTVITATIMETAKGSELSLTMRMREVAPSTSNLPRREYPPPTALQAGLNKIWDAIDRQLKAVPTAQ